MTDLVWNRHSNDLGDWCPWSGSVISDDAAQEESPACPAMCQSSHPIEGPDPEFDPGPSERQVMDWEEHNAHAGDGE